MLHVSSNYTMLLLSSILNGFASSFIWIACDSFIISNSNEDDIAKILHKYRNGELAVDLLECL